MAFDQQRIDDQIEQIIKDVVAGDGYEKGSEEELIKAAYEAFMAYDFENEPIPEDLTDVIGEIDGITSMEEFWDVDARLVREYGMGGMLNAMPAVNAFDPKETVMTFNQITGVLSASFTDMRDYIYTVDSVRDDAQIVLSTRGRDKETAEKTGRELANLAIDLYGSTDMEITEALMPYKYQKIYTAEQINELLSNVDLNDYWEDIGYDSNRINSYCVCDEEQLKALNALFVEENLEALKAWELCNLYSSYARYIAPHYPQLAGFVYRDYSSMEDQAIDEISQAFMSETDPLYVEKHYTPEMDKALRSMCDDIRAGYRELISGADWLTEDTRAELLKKLENIEYVTGTDLKRHDNSVYQNICSGNYYEICKNYNRIAFQEMIEGLYKTASNKEVTMPMQIFNACYNPSLNNITITVAITNDPFFDVNADYYTNLGGLGMVIAHEMGHAFDSNCIVFNSKGEYDPSWIPDEDMNMLVQRNEKAVRYFEDNFTVFGVYHVDGEMTLGENYADLGALECITSLTGTKDDRIKLFESYATIWCQMSTDDAIINQIAYDVHSPAVIRVNAVIASIDEFYETYDVQEGDGMYIAPEDRISRWY